MPVTRARTSATRTGATRPGNSVVSGTDLGCTVTTPTSGGGIWKAPGPLELRLQPANTAISAPRPAGRYCRIAARERRGNRKRQTLANLLRMFTTLLSFWFWRRHRTGTAPQFARQRADPAGISAASDETRRKNDPAHKIRKRVR